MFCHDRVSSEDYFLPRRYYPRVKQDPVDLILSGSVLHYIPSSPLDNSLPLSRDVPSARKEDATIVYLQRTNRPLVREGQGEGRQGEGEGDREGGRGGGGGGRTKARVCILVSSEGKY